MTTAVRWKWHIWWFTWTVFACFNKCPGFWGFLPALANDGVRYSCKGLAVAQYSSVLVQVPSNLTSVAPIHQEPPTWKSTLAHFVLLLSSLQFCPFVQPVKPSWLINIMLCVPHTAGFSGSCPVSEKLTYGHSSRGVAGTKCSSSSLHTPASHGVPRWSEESNWQPCCHPHRQACRPQLPSVSTGNLLYGKLGVLNHEVHSRCWSVVTEQRRCFSNIGAEFPV